MSKAISLKYTKQIFRIKYKINGYKNDKDKYKTKNKR